MWPGSQTSLLQERRIIFIVRFVLSSLLHNALHITWMYHALRCSTLSSISKRKWLLLKWKECNGRVIIVFTTTCDRYVGQYVTKSLQRRTIWNGMFKPGVKPGWKFLFLSIGDLEDEWISYIRNVLTHFYVILYFVRFCSAKPGFIAFPPFPSINLNKYSILNALEKWTFLWKKWKKYFISILELHFWTQNYYDEIILFLMFQ